MLEYSELPPLSSLYHEVLMRSVDTHPDENSPSAARKLPVQPLQEKDSQKNPEQNLPSSEPKPPPPGQPRPKKVPTQWINPDPILPGLQIKLTQGFQVKIIVSMKYG